MRSAPCSRSPLLLYCCLLGSFLYFLSRHFTQHEGWLTRQKSQPRHPGYRISVHYPPNIEHSSPLSRLTAQRIFPQESKLDTWRKRNQDEFVRLLHCHHSGGRHHACSPKDRSVVLFGTVHFTRVIQGLFLQKASFPAGEGIWADALLWALKQLKYPYLVVDGSDHNDTNTRLGEIHKSLGPSVKMVIGDYLSMPQCLRNSACSKSNLNPSGIPHHKLFVFDGFGQDVGHPLGRKWHLTFYPQQERNFTYLGLTIEHYCHQFGVIPPSQRSDKIYILGKDRSYLHPPSPTLYPKTMWSSITNATGIEFTMGTLQQNLGTETTDEKNQLIDGIVDIGTQSRESFIHELQRHRAIIGLGWPVQPSTPLEALCVGTPYINPVWVGRRSQPDRSKWHTQHPFLAQFDPPYVYNVQDHREDDVLKAIEQIIENPLGEAFIPDEMKKENYLKRIDRLIRLDWEELAKAQNSQ